MNELTQIAATKGKILGVDFGDTRTGLAVSDQRVLVELNHKGGEGVGYLSVLLDVFSVVTGTQGHGNVTDIEQLAILEIGQQILSTLGAIHQQTIGLNRLIDGVALGITEVVGVTLQVEIGDLFHGGLAGNDRAVLIEGVVVFHFLAGSA